MITSAATANVEIPAGRAPSVPMMFDDRLRWRIGDLLGVDDVERVEAKRRLRDLQKSCCVNRGKVLENIGKAGGLAAELIHDAVATSIAEVEVADPRIDKLTEQLASTKAEVVLLMSKLYNIEKVHDKANLKHEELLKEI